jgi:hypothetical protein
MSSSATSSSSAGSNPSSGSAKPVVRGGPKPDRKPFVGKCRNCNKEGHWAANCPEPYEKAMAALAFAVANCNRTPDALAEKAALNARMQVLEEKLVAQVQAAVPVVSVNGTVIENFHWRDFVDVEPIEIDHPEALPASKEVPTAFQGCQTKEEFVDLLPALGPNLVDVVSDIKVLNNWETFWYVLNFAWYCLMVLMTGGALSGIICLLLVDKVALAACIVVLGWSTFLWYCWQFSRLKSDYVTYKLVGSAYSERVWYGDRRSITWRTCPVTSPDYIPNARYMTYRLSRRINGRFTTKLVTISHELFLEACAPKNVARYSSADSLKTAFADTLSFLRTHGHVNLDRDLQAHEQILHETTKFFVCKLKVDLFNDEVSTNVICP